MVAAPVLCAALLLLISWCEPAPLDKPLLYSVMDHGVVGDGFHDDTFAMQQLLNTVPPRSVVVVPLGCVVVSGPLTIRRDDFTFRIDGRLQAWDATPDVLNFKWRRLPPLPTYGDSRDAGQYLQYQALIYAVNVTNFALSGNGVVDGRGQAWWDAFRSHNRTQLLRAGRPNLIQLVNTTGITISFVQLQDSPFWTLHPVLCENIHIHNLSITAPLYAPNVDGIDIDSCCHVLIEYVDIACGDDHIAVKAGVCGESSPNNCSDSAWSTTPNGPFRTNNVTIQHSTFRRGMGLAIGSEMSGSVTNVHIHHNRIGVCQSGSDPTVGCGWGPALHVKSTISRGGRIENITFSDNKVWNTSIFILVEMDYQSNSEAKPPIGYAATLIRNVSFVSNHALGSATGATFACSRYAACHSISVIGNKIASPSGNPTPWHCRFIARDFVVHGNSPVGLRSCMANSMQNETLANLPSLLVS